jgi:hypothetical protein
MRRFRLASLAALVALSISTAIACGPSPDSKAEARASAEPALKWTVLIVTGAEDVSPDEWRRAKALAGGNGSAPGNVQVVHAEIPADKWRRQADVAQSIAEFADKAGARAIIVAPSPRGTVNGVAAAKEANPDLVAVLVEPIENPIMVQRVADLALNVDYLQRPYALFQAARKAGAASIVDVVNPAGEGYEPFDRKRLALEFAAEEAGVPLVRLRVSPNAKKGETVEDFLARELPAALEAAGEPTWISFDRGLPAASLYSAIRDRRAFVIEEDIPSISEGLCVALGLDPASRWQADAYKAVEKAAIALGAAGRFGAWIRGWGETAIDAAVAHLAAVFDGKARVDSIDSVASALASTNQGSVWRVGYYPDAFSGVDARSHLLVYQDPYVFGRGFLSLTKYETPKALRILQPAGTE